MAMYYISAKTPTGVEWWLLDSDGNLIDAYWMEDVRPSWNEIKERALAFSKEWEDECSEHARLLRPRLEPDQPCDLWLSVSIGDGWQGTP